MPEVRSSALLKEERLWQTWIHLVICFRHSSIMIDAFKVVTIVNRFGILMSTDVLEKPGEEIDEDIN